MAKVRVADIIVDDSSVRGFVRLVQRGRGSFTNRALKNAAEEIRYWYVDRFSKAGYGSWHPLDPAYAARKPINSDKILILSYQLMESISTRAIPGRRNSWEVGYVGPLAERRYENITNMKMFDFSGTIESLAEIHQVTRPIIVPLSSNQVNRVMEMVNTGADRDVDKANKRVLKHG